ncbi:MAG: HmuY family protein [Parabacteroides sp.]|nr:HmuY family protein [Parabacteroides sp.]
MKRGVYLFTCLAATLLYTTSCSDDPNSSDDTPVSDEVKTCVVNATSYKDWVYFSFVSGNSIEVADPKTSLDWDIAFHRYDMRTNGGASGSGNAGVIKRTEEDLSAIFEIPQTGYEADKMDSVNYAGMPPVNTADSRNLLLSSYMDVDTRQMPPQYTLHSNVFVVRTAKGRYAKLRFTDYRNDKDVKGHIKIEYIYPVK